MSSKKVSKEVADKKMIDKAEKEMIDKKDVDLSLNKEDGTNQFLTTNQGLKINDDQNSLKAGERGATLLEDFILREKITHFDHERIPERIVHARGTAAHGYFELYESQAKYTKAKFLNDTSRRTPVFTRFSTVAGSRGSSDLARDVRGFSVKFYTDEGIYDFVGNNIPVFFIQDTIKFPDLIHAVKPEPHNEIPQAASAHDTFYDFITNNPESMHMIMWVMSDRAIPRSLRMIEGFGVHTFSLINEAGERAFVKFHWKPLLGVHAVTWDEAQKISGKDPDFHRRDLWEAINNGAFPEWELGLQIVPEADEHKFDFDILDATKLIPEELVPVIRIGKMVLNKNPDNYFAETEQVAFHPAHLVPGLDFTNDPLLQGRLFSYTDTQLSRLGSPNFHEIPINRSVAPVHNNQREGHMRQTINTGRVAYNPNSINAGSPNQAKVEEGGFTTYMERVDAKKIRGRSKSFFDHYSQATLFFNSQSQAEKNHIINALSFELSKVTIPEIRSKMVTHLRQINTTLASKVAINLGIIISDKIDFILNNSVPANINPADYQSVTKKQSIKKSDALSMEHTIKDSIKTRQIAILITLHSDEKMVNAMKKALWSEGAIIKLIAPTLGFFGADETPIDQSFLVASSVLFDAVYVPGGTDVVEKLSKEANVVHFINEAYRHCKAIAIDASALSLLEFTYAKNNDFTAANNDAGIIVITDKVTSKIGEFVNAISQHRNWDRELEQKVPA